MTRRATHIVLSAALGLWFGPLAAQAFDPTLSAMPPLAGDWRPETQNIARPTHMTLGCVSKSDCTEGQEHGTFEIDPYSRVLPEEDGRHRMVSDSLLDIVLVPKPDADHTFTIDGTSGVLELRAAGDCTFGNPCFVVSGLTDADLQTNGLSEMPNGTYERPPRLAEDKGLSQTLGDNFAPLPSSFEDVLRCYDAVVIDRFDFSETGCKLDIFRGAAVGTKRYTPRNAPDERNLGVPHGWKLEFLTGGWGKSRAKLISTERELIQSHMSKTGWKTGANLVIVNFSVQHNKTVASKSDALYSSEKQYTEFDYVGRSFALVLDKWNAPLSDAFERSVQKYIKDRDADDFFRLCGTHYAFATTMGERGYLFSTINKTQASQLHNNEVSTSIGASAGISIPLEEFELPGNLELSGGGDSASAQSHSFRMKSILSDDMSVWRCVGGISCNGKNATGTNSVPILLDLRPISDLLGPPILRALLARSTRATISVRLWQSGYLCNRRRALTRL